MASRNFLPGLLLSVIVAVFTMSVTCQGSPVAGVETKDWGKVGDRQVRLYSITNADGMVLEMTDFGAKITSLIVPDRNGELEDVVLGFDNLQQYIEPNQSIGATIGRVANRIRRGRIVIDGDAIADSFGSAVVQSYHQVLTDGDAQMQRQVMREFSGIIADMETKGHYLALKYHF